jgi:amino acid transporter
MATDNSTVGSERSPLLSSNRQSGEASQTEDQYASFANDLTARDGFTLLITVIIGSGIFASPSAIDTNVPSPGIALLIWLAGGLLAWTGATTMAELGAVFPEEGGIQEYLKMVYGDAMGFLAAWTWIMCVMPATLGILGIVFVKTAYEAVFSRSEVASSSWAQKGFSVLVIFVTALVNCMGTKTSTTLNNISALIKLLSIGFIVIAAVVVAIIYTASHGRYDPGGGDWHESSWFHARLSVTPDGNVDWRNINGWETFGHLCAAIYAALWAYAGWDKACFARKSSDIPANICW